MSRHTAKRSNKQRNEHGNLAEFGPVLYVFVLLILLPLMNIGFFSIGVMGVQLLVSEAARSASSADTRQKALDAMKDKANMALHSGLLQVAKAQAVNGYQNCGCTLYCKKLPSGGGNGQTFNLNGPLPPADRPTTGANETNFIYEYATEGEYKVYPLLDMTGIPIVGGIPGVSGPQTVKFAATNLVENPRALDN